jgi:hypothetical protein
VINWFSMPLAFAAALSAAAGQGATSGGETLPPKAFSAPTRFDYLVLASVAASRRPLSLAGYTPQPAAQGD